MESLQFVGCSWFIGLIGLGFRFTQNKSTSTELCALLRPSPVSSSTRLDAPGVHSLAARGDDRRFVRPQPGTPRRAAVQRRQDFPRNDPGDISAFLCNILEANNVQPKRVLRARNLPTHDLQDGHALDALFQAALPQQPTFYCSYRNKI